MRVSTQPLIRIATTFALAVGAMGIMGQPSNAESIGYSCEYLGDTPVTLHREYQGAEPTMLILWTNDIEWQYSPLERDKKICAEKRY
ncbi:MAG: hypothetical protein F6J86_42485 [Symploca sp. SIO1B1]|nr:hypothetical protein [Symploca sp. SIO1B1]